MTQEPDEMDETYGNSPAPAGDKTKSVDEQEAQEMSQKAVIPLKVLMGNSTEPLKEGDEVVVKVTGIHGQEVEIEYSKTKPGEIGEEPEATEEMSPEAELDEMGKDY